jgi:hypothetical protein
MTLKIPPPTRMWKPFKPTSAGGSPPRHRMTIRRPEAYEPEYQPPFAAAGIFATIRRLVVSSSSCSHGRSQATAL